MLLIYIIQQNFGWLELSPSESEWENQKFK